MVIAASFDPSYLVIPLVCQTFRSLAPDDSCSDRAQRGAIGKVGGLQFSGRHNIAIGVCCGSGEVDTDLFNPRQCVLVLAKAELLFGQAAAIAFAKVGAVAVPVAHHGLWTYWAILLLDDVGQFISQQVLTKARAGSVLSRGKDNVPTDGVRARLHRGRSSAAARPCGLSPVRSHGRNAPQRLG